MSNTNTRKVGRPKITKETKQVIVYPTKDQKKFLDINRISSTKLFRQAVNAIKNNELDYDPSDDGLE